MKSTTEEIPNEAIYLECVDETNHFLKKGDLTWTTWFEKNNEFTILENNKYMYNFNTKKFARLYTNQTMAELIKDANVKYPEGTRFITKNHLSPNGYPENIGTRQGEIISWENEYYEYGEALASRGSGILYYKGRWAEIISDKRDETADLMQMYNKVEDLLAENRDVCPLMGTGYGEDLMSLLEKPFTPRESYEYVWGISKEIPQEKDGVVPKILQLALLSEKPEYIESTPIKIVNYKQIKINQNGKT